MAKKSKSKKPKAKQLPAKKTTPQKQRRPARGFEARVQDLEVALRDLTDRVQALESPVVAEEAEGEDEPAMAMGK